MTLEECREFYAEEVRMAAGVRSAALVKAFGTVPREKFLGNGPWQIALADLELGASYTATDNADPRWVYHDVAIALDAHRDLTNGQPGTLARWIDELDVRPGERIFHLDSGSGYYTAILAEVTGPGGSVVASEVDSPVS